MVEPGLIMRIVADRRRLQPSPVKLGHVPNWLRLLIGKRIDCTSCRYNHGEARIWHAAAACDAKCILDHLGSTIYQGREAFVAEPYMGGGLPASIDLPLHLKEPAERFAATLGLNLIVTDNSWWNPGRTVRLLFVQKEPGNG